jgi:hypothetical protein
MRGLEDLKTTRGRLFDRPSEALRQRAALVGEDPEYFVTARAPEEERASFVDHERFGVRFYTGSGGVLEGAPACGPVRG